MSGDGAFSFFMQASLKRCSTGLQGSVRVRMPSGRSEGHAGADKLSADTADHSGTGLMDIVITGVSLCSSFIVSVASRSVRTSRSHCGITANFTMSAPRDCIRQRLFTMMFLSGVAVKSWREATTFTPTRWAAATIVFIVSSPREFHVNEIDETAVDHGEDRLCVGFGIDLQHSAFHAGADREEDRDISQSIAE